MKNEWTMPKWMQKYISFFMLPKYIFINGEQQKLSIKKIEKLYNDDIDDSYNIADFIETDRIQIQVKLLEKLHKEGCHI